MTASPRMPPSRRRRWLAVAALAVGATAVAVFLWSRGESSGPLRVGCRHAPPFYTVVPGQPPSGIAVDVINEAARRLGATPQWVVITGQSDEALRDGLIDIWPSMTVLPERRAMVHFTEPWLQSDYFLLHRADAPIAGPGDMTGRAVAFVKSVNVTRLVQRHVPSARYVGEMRSVEAIEAVCTGNADAAFVEAREAQALLLDRPPACVGIRLAFTKVEAATQYIAVASGLARAAVADALRERIGDMAEDGTLGRITDHWTLGPSNEAGMLYAVLDAQRRTRLARYGIVVLVAGLVVAVFAMQRARQARAAAEAATASLQVQARELGRYHQLFEHTLAGVFRSTVDGTIQECNDAFARICGFDSKVDMIGRDAWTMHADPAARAAAIEALQRAEPAGDLEIQIRRRDGRLGHVLASVSLLPARDGEMAEVEGTVIDITRLKQLEEENRQAQKLESVGRLAGGVAHDFNNLLTAINGYAELLLETTPAGDPAREAIEQIHQAGDRAARLTRQLLAFSRKQMLRPEVLDLNRVVADFEKMLRRVIGEDVVLETRLGPGLQTIRADAGQVEQVIMNLAVNARDAMAGGGSLRIETANVDVEPGSHLAQAGLQAGPHVLMTVADTGSGMDLDTLAHLFEPFFTTKGPGRGTGLGLSTVYGIVKQSGGHVEVHSEVGRGTRFDIYLPAVDASPAGRPAVPVAVREGGRETILLVEDQEDVRRFTAQALGRFGYTVIEAASGEEAIGVCERHTVPVALLLTDVVMPGMTGREVASRALELRSDIKVLYMSGYADPELAPSSLPDEGAAFIAKPFTPSALARRVRDVLDAGAAP